MYTLPSREELLKMPLNRLRNVRIENGDQEKIVQEIVNIHVAKRPPVEKVYRGDVPFMIKTVQEEKYWQDIIDKRTQELIDKQASAGMSAEQKIEAELVKLEAEKTKLEGKTFCQFCDAKGPISHKKVCTRK